MKTSTILERLRGGSPVLSVGLLTADWMNLGSEVSILERTGVPLVHFDVMDGRIWPKITIGPSFVQGIRTILLKDVHLLIDRPELYIESFVKAGADFITFSAECCLVIQETLQRLDRMRSVNDTERRIVKGLSINPATSVSVIEPFVEDIDAVVLLAVGPENVKQNSLSLISNKIKAVRALRDDLLIYVDGSVNRNNIAEIAAMSPDIIVTGSAVFDGRDAVGNLEYMLNVTKKR
jgi:ribulose-phosphate 3-epimerase